jgi:hypothetical protein
LSELRGVEAAGASGIDVFNAGGDRQLCPAQAHRQAMSRSFGKLVLDRDAETILKGSIGEVRKAKLLFEGGSHAGEAQLV